MKFRILTNEELSHLENDLKAFLIVNGVEGDSWEKLNISEPQKAIALVELFSDQVLQKVYEKVQYLEHRSEKSCLVFHCLSEEMKLIALQLKEESSASLASVESIHEALTLTPKDISFFTSQKKYSKNREEEIHQMISEGCVLSSEDFYSSLKKLV